MAELIAGSGVACCLMHNRHDKNYKEFILDFKSDIKETLELASEAGIKKEKIILDPGIGFVKSLQQNLELIKRPEILSKMGFPMLLGTSRKSFIGAILDCTEEERLDGTLATTVLAAKAGYAFVRVHDVKENKRAIMITEAVLNNRLV